MLANPRRRRQAPDLETNTAPDTLRDGRRRDNQRQPPPDSMPKRAGGGQDASPGDYEWEIQRIDAATVERNRLG